MMNELQLLASEFPRPVNRVSTALPGRGGGEGTLLCLTPVWSVPATPGEIWPINDDIMEQEEWNPRSAQEEGYRR